MVGRKVTLRRLKAYLRDLGDVIECVHTTEFCQGRQVRWGLAWQAAPPKEPKEFAAPSQVLLFSDSDSD